MTSVIDAPATPAVISTPIPSPTPPPTRLRPVLWVVGWVLAGIGLMLLLFAGYLYGLSAQQQHRSQTLLYADLRGQFAQATAPVGAPLAQGKPMAYLEIPSIGLHQVVVEGSSSGDLTKGPGHRPDSAWPGQPGVSVIAGKRATFGGPFGRVGRLQLNAPIYVTTGQGRATYTVSDVRRSDQESGPLISPNRLVLVTAASPMAPQHTILVTAILKGMPQPSGARGALSSDERTLVGDSSAALPLALWGQLLLVAVALTVWLALTWRKLPTYLVAAPVLIALLWNVFENASRLLPNLV